MSVRASKKSESQVATRLEIVFAFLELLCSYYWYLIFDIIKFSLVIYNRNFKLQTNASI